MGGQLPRHPYASLLTKKLIPINEVAKIVIITRLRIFMSEMYCTMYRLKQWRIISLDDCYYFDALREMENIIC